MNLVSIKDGIKVLFRTKRIIVKQVEDRFFFLFINYESQKTINSPPLIFLNSFSILGGLSENLCNVPFTQNWYSITKTYSSSPRTTPFLTEKFTCQCRNLSIFSCLLLHTSVFPEDSILYSVCNWSHLTQVQNFPPYSLSVSYSECPAYQELPLNSFVPAHSVIPFGPNRHLSFSQDGSDPEPLPGRP